MTDPYRVRVKYVIGPDGGPLTMTNLPAPNTKRWGARHKAQVVAAIRSGLLSLDEACDRYKLSMEEFLSWRNAVDRYGLAGLRTTKIQEYRAPIDPVIGKPGAVPRTAKARRLIHRAAQRRAPFPLPENEKTPPGRAPQRGH